MVESPAPLVIVAGSLNVDYFSLVAALPRPGETVAATDLRIVFGGKGANQAIAARRQGARVAMIGSVGDDEMGAAYLAHLAHEGVETGAVRRQPDIPTGSAFISVDRAGENTIVVAAGANGETTRAQIGAEEERIARATAVLVQLEIPVPAVLEVIRLANQHEVPVIFNPSPLSHAAEFHWGSVRIDYLVANETEAASLFGYPEKAGNIGMFRRELGKQKIGTLLVTRGADPTAIVSATEQFEVPALPVTPVDTVGAGDAFAGTLAARLAGGASLRDAVEAANCAGALTTLGPGAQDPIPDKATVDERLRRGGPSVT